MLLHLEQADRHGTRGASNITEAVMNRPKFKVGQSVYYLGRESASGTYQVIQLLPPEGDDFQFGSRVRESLTTG